VWGVLEERIVSFGATDKGLGSGSDGLIGWCSGCVGCFRPAIPGRRAGRF
jgi:hypothetical protein